MNYTLTQTEYRNLKSKLTRARNSKDHNKVILVVNEAMSIFMQKGYPDDWHRWERAKDDAEIALRFSGSKW
jgi:tellurite resistance-related uncharacterized protein